MVWFSARPAEPDMSWERRLLTWRVRESVIAPTYPRGSIDTLACPALPCLAFPPCIRPVVFSTLPCLVLLCMPCLLCCPASSWFPASAALPCLVCVPALPALSSRPVLLSCLAYSAFVFPCLACCIILIACIVCELPSSFESTLRVCLRVGVSSEFCFP